MDIENQATAAESQSHGPPVTSMTDGSDRTEQLRAVARRLAAEFENVDQESQEDDHDTATAVSTPPVTASHDPSIHKSPVKSAVPLATEAYLMSQDALERLNEKEKVVMRKAMKARGAHALLSDFQTFSNLQYDLITKAITGGTLTDCSARRPLRIHANQPSIFNTYGNDYVRGKDVQPGTAESTPLLGLHSGWTTPKTAASGLSTPNIRRRKVQVEDPMHELTEADENDSGDDRRLDLGDEEALEETGNHSLLMVYSLLFALGYDQARSLSFLPPDSSLNILLP